MVTETISVRVAVRWDEDDPAESFLPDTVRVPDNIVHAYRPEDDDTISDWLSEMFGDCVNTWKFMPGELDLYRDRHATY